MDKELIKLNNDIKFIEGNFYYYEDISTVILECIRIEPYCKQCYLKPICNKGQFNNPNCKVLKLDENNNPYTLGFIRKCSAAFINEENHLANTTVSFGIMDISKPEEPINIISSKTFKSKKDYWLEEYDKCITSPYYFYTNYWLVNGKKAITNLSEEEFNKNFKPYKK